MMMQHQKVKNKMNGKKIPQRKCVGCNEMKDKSAFSPRGKDTGGYLSCGCQRQSQMAEGLTFVKIIECFHKAMKNKGLERSLKM